MSSIPSIVPSVYTPESLATSLERDPTFRSTGMPTWAYSGIKNREHCKAGTLSPIYLNKELIAVEELDGPFENCPCEERIFGERWAFRARVRNYWQLPTPIPVADIEARIGIQTRRRSPQFVNRMTHPYNSFAIPSYKPVPYSAEEEARGKKAFNDFILGLVDQLKTSVAQVPVATPTNPSLDASVASMRQILERFKNILKSMTDHVEILCEKLSEIQSVTPEMMNTIVYTPLPTLEIEEPPVPVVTTTVVPEDSYKNHKYRIGDSINMKLCMGRRIDDRNPIPGTSPKFYPEKQCSHRPEKGEALCKRCGEKDTEAKNIPKKPIRGWYGRLDEPMYWNAAVIGCERFNARYPKGLPETCVSHIETS